MTRAKAIEEAARAVVDWYRHHGGTEYPGLTDRVAILRAALSEPDPGPDDRLYTENRVLVEAVNLSCTCGGRGPHDDGVCPACMVWHRLRSYMEQGGDDDMLHSSK